MPLRKTSKPSLRRNTDGRSFGRWLPGRMSSAPVFRWARRGLPLLRPRDDILDVFYLRCVPRTSKRADDELTEFGSVKAVAIEDFLKPWAFGIDRIFLLTPSCRPGNESSHNGLLQDRDRLKAASLLRDSSFRRVCECVWAHKDSTLTGELAARGLEGFLRDVTMISSDRCVSPEPWNTGPGD
jgi:hypothetical protein